MYAFARAEVLRSLVRSTSTTELYALAVGRDSMLVESILASEATQEIGVAT